LITESKEAMLLSLEDGIADEAQHTMPAGRSCRERMEQLAAAYLTRIQDNRALSRILFGETPASSGRGPASC
jgi:hypothetical protein